MLVSPKDLKVGDTFKLTGESCQPALPLEPGDYLLVEKMDGVHITRLCGRDSDGGKHEFAIGNWVKVEKVETP